MHSPVGVDPVWLAQSRLRRRKWEQCTDLCSELLSKNPYDQVITHFPHIEVQVGLSMTVNTP